MECKRLNLLMSVFKRFNYFFIFLLAGALSLISVDKSSANNLQFNNFEVYATNTSANTITYTADLNWDNSWKTVGNNDAVWVFLKYSTNGGSSWSHATMGGSGLNPNGFSAPAGFDIIVPQDQRGFFLQRNGLGSGTSTAQNVRFVWNYGDRKSVV